MQHRRLATEDSVATRAKSFVQENSDAPAVSTPIKKILLDLPPELITLISSYLPPFSIAAFALCNKKLAEVLGPQSWTSLDASERIQFLTLLSRQLPSQHACHGCAHLHFSKSTPRPGDTNVWQQPKSCIPASSLGSYTEPGLLRISNYFGSYHLRFDHIQLALKRHHQGSEHGMGLKDLSFTELRLINSKAYFFTVEARISHGELILRSQEWIVSIQHPREQIESQGMTYSVCEHLTTFAAMYGIENILTRLIQCRLEHEFGDDECVCMSLHQCLICPLEYRLDFVDMPDIGFALYVTRWLNFGAGSTAYDPLWVRHNLLPDEPPPHGLPFGIRSRFECQGGLPVEDLTSKSRIKAEMSWCVLCL